MPSDTIVMRLFHVLSSLMTSLRERWNLPHALGARDGQYIPIRCPRQVGSQYFNDKGFHSLVLLDLCGGSLQKNYCWPTDPKLCTSSLVMTPS